MGVKAQNTHENGDNFPNAYQQCLSIPTLVSNTFIQKTQSFTDYLAYNIVKVPFIGL